MPDVLLVETNQFEDDRGFIQEIYKESDFKEQIPQKFVQVIHSYSKKGVLRGLHFQMNPKLQGKLVTVISGVIYDVAVDLRKDSPTYKKWVGTELTPGMLLWVPVGFAHGFEALEDSNLIYLMTDEFSKEYDSGIAWNDQEINVDWPIKHPIISEKDRSLPSLAVSNY
jgi:dTDP-4-dehydrorhamnose 3,5-epimerase